MKNYIKAEQAFCGSHLSADCAVITKKCYCLVYSSDDWLIKKCGIQFVLNFGPGCSKYRNATVLAFA